MNPEAPVTRTLTRAPESGDDGGHLAARDNKVIEPAAYLPQGMEPWYSNPRAIAGRLAGRFFGPRSMLASGLVLWCSRENTRWKLGILGQFAEYALPDPLV
jgi:hypothetical protein